MFAESSKQSPKGKITEHKDKDQEKLDLLNSVSSRVLSKSVLSISRPTKPSPTGLTSLDFLAIFTDMSKRQLIHLFTL